ncbi:hypothetical protein IDF50_22385 [Klebsiella pneumoniae]|uniref:hypothetical protein n=1 Tax=Klebsiella TaxID=570 RepID=UPI0004969F75|nr:hypothetical protein [Klebsiella pneumoniae]HCA7142681.1 hypothetical protein [Klebsiella michiganensis]HDS9344854.1 hypothetical protein [Klebsiella pneumoniae subsp. pneumoniae]MBC4340517.1 hypothetical protein [Klebsiella pneumoniae]MBK2478843.1 hypothetical protein [Klebsiella pneumoniae]MCB3773849.1 hypothetical protein [Klebsiella pneumoniae]
MSHKKEHTVMVYKVLQELARQQGQTVEAVLEQLFCRASIVNTGLLNESFREAFSSIIPASHSTTLPGVLSASVSTLCSAPTRWYRVKLAGHSVPHSFDNGYSFPSI